MPITYEMNAKYYAHAQLCIPGSFPRKKTKTDDEKEIQALRKNANEGKKKKKQKKEREIEIVKKNGGEK